MIKERLQEVVRKHVRDTNTTQAAVHYGWSENAGRCLKGADALQRENMYWRRAWDTKHWTEIVRFMQPELKEKVISEIIHLCGAGSEVGDPVQLHQKVILKRAMADNSIIEYLTSGCRRALIESARFADEMARLWSRKAKALNALAHDSRSPLRVGGGN